MRQDSSGHRIFILGAGFSQPAGLPLGSDLYDLVRENLGKSGGLKGFEKDLESFCDYKQRCFGNGVGRFSFDFEEFMEFLDFRHFLLLEGSDTWSDEGNSTQLAVRCAIAQEIHRRTPAAKDIPDVYFKFVDSLESTDLVVTLNYDILLERCFDARGKKFRLFPARFSEIGVTAKRIDSTKDETVILKIHGSVDWFDKKEYLNSVADFRKIGLPRRPQHDVIFSQPSAHIPKRIADGPRSADDPFRYMCRIKNVNSYYNSGAVHKAPFILSPSRAKFLYSGPLRDFWYRIGAAGGWNLGISIIGYSLPAHDEYMGMWLFQLLLYYQESWWDAIWLGSALKDNVKFVDFQKDENSIDAYKKRFSFADESKTSFCFSGFNEGAVEFLFTHQR